MDKKSNNKSSNKANNVFDVIVVGGGVVGTLILRELSKYNLHCALLEKEDDVGYGATRANSGISHAGYDCEPGTLKAKLNVKGNAMMPELTSVLGVPFSRCGSLVLADKEHEAEIKRLYDKGIANGCKVEIIYRKRILEIEPNVADGIYCALWAPEAGVVSPYKLAIKSADQAILNGAKVFTEAEVTSITRSAGGKVPPLREGAGRTDGDYIVTTTKGEFRTKLLINSAGAGAVAINGMLGDVTPECELRLGEYMVMDKTHEEVKTVLFPVPDEKGKGILVSPTADGNVIYGPTSTRSCDGIATTTADGLQQIRDQVERSYKKPDYRKIIRLYAGMRATVGHDFTIENSTKNPGFIYLLGIASPGLTSAPAIAEVVAKMVGKHIKLTKKAHFELLPLHTKIAELHEIAVNANIALDPAFGRVICRCERVTEGEIVRAIHSPLPARTVDAVKRRVRSGMGRCQGGFCMPSVIKILARELNLPVTAIKKGGKGSEICK